MIFIIAYTIFLLFVIVKISDTKPIMDEINSIFRQYNDDTIFQELYSEDEDTDDEEDIYYSQRQEELNLSPENKTKHGYEKDGFVVDDDYSSEDDYSTQEFSSEDDYSTQEFSSEDELEVAEIDDYTTSEDETY